LIGGGAVEKRVVINPRIGFGFGNVAEIGFDKRIEVQKEVPNTSSDEIPVIDN